MTIITRFVCYVWTHTNCFGKKTELILKVLLWSPPNQDGLAQTYAWDSLFRAFCCVLVSLCVRRTLSWPLRDLCFFNDTLAVCMGCLRLRRPYRMTAIDIHDVHCVLGKHGLNKNRTFGVSNAGLTSPRLNCARTIPSPPTWNNWRTPFKTIAYAGPYRADCCLSGLL